MISDSALVVRSVETSHSYRRKRVLYIGRFMGQREVCGWLTSAVDSGQTSIVTCIEVKGKN